MTTIYSNFEDCILFWLSIKTSQVKKTLIFIQDMAFPNSIEILLLLCLKDAFINVSDLTSGTLLLSCCPHVNVKDEIILKDIKMWIRETDYRHHWRFLSLCLMQSNNSFISFLHFQKIMLPRIAHMQIQACHRMESASNSKEENNVFSFYI